jgi:hypothetical protein
MADFNQGAPNTVSRLTQSAQSTQPTTVGEEGNDLPHGSSSVDREQSRERQRVNSTTSQSHTVTPSRGGTLKKRRSLSRKGSLKRELSRRSSRPGSIKGVGLDGQGEHVGDAGSEYNSVFHTPVTTSGSPTEILATRFQGGLSSTPTTLAAHWFGLANHMRYRLAQSTQGLDHLLSRHSKIVRREGEVSAYVVQCHQQYQHPPSVSG